MKAGRGVLIACVALVSVALIVGGQFAIQQHFENRRARLVSPALAYPPFAGLRTRPAVPSAREDSDPPGIARSTDLDAAEVLLDDTVGKVGIGPGSAHPEAPHADLAAGLEPAADDVYVDDEGPQFSPPSSPLDEAPPAALPDATAGIGDKATAALPDESDLAPEKLPAPDDASPINAAPDAESSLRAIIEQELPHAGSDERAIWLEQLKGLPPHVMRDLLRLRRKLAVKDSFRISNLPHPWPAETAGPTIESAEPPLPELAIDRELPVDRFVEVETRIESAQSAIQLARDVVLNNIANANTFGFKRSRPVFEDLPYQNVGFPGGRNSQDSPSLGISIGHGVRVTGTQPDFSQGDLRHTRLPLDVAISGEGFFQVQAGGQVQYTRSGRFALNSGSQIVLAGSTHCCALEPPINVPHDSAAIEISSDGIVTVRQPGAVSDTQIGQFQIARFANPAALEPQGEGLYAATEASGPASAGVPGTDGRGGLHQGYLEQSNVDLAEELNELRRLIRHLHALRLAAQMAPRYATESPIQVPPSGWDDSHTANQDGATTPRR